MTLWATLPVSSFAVYDSFLRAIDSSGFAALTTEFLCRVPYRPFKCQDQSRPLLRRLIVHHLGGCLVGWV